IEQNVSATGGANPCGTASTPAALIRFSWDNPSSAQTPPVTRVAYYLKSLGGGTNELHRIRCIGNSTIVSDIVLAPDVLRVPPVSGASPATCTGTPVPQTVALTMQIQVPGSNDPPLVVTLSGQRRQT